MSVVSNPVTSSSASGYDHVPRSNTHLGNVTELLSSLSSKSHLERDRAVSKFRLIVPSLTPADYVSAQNVLLSRLTPEEQWYSVHSAVCAICHLLCAPNTPQTVVDQSSFITSLQEATKLIVTHHEARVRESSAALIKTLAEQAPQSTWQSLSPMLFARADETFTLDVQQRASEAARIAARDVDNAAGDAKTKSARNLLHETEGWRGLETTLLAQAALTRHSSPYCMEDESLGELLGCAERARPHPNRFVREAGLHLIDAIGAAAGLLPDSTGSEDGQRLTTLIKIVTTILPSLRAGLQDNWSQVRFAACVATRTLMLLLPVSKREEMLFPELLPRLCLNRHYVAEGVKSYSHETWRLLFQNTPEGGRPWLTRLLPQVVQFFASETQANNHAVREAACQSFGELATRMPEPIIRPHALSIASALRDGFKDESWPVRDHACGALADVLATFPHELDAAAAAQGSDILREIHGLFSRHLADNIVSVRQNCATGFVRAVGSFADSHAIMGYANLIPVVRDHLVAINTQKDDSTTSVATTTAQKDTQFGSSTRLAGEHVHDAAHTNQTMYSCGSLAPKLRRGGGCSDHGFVRPREQWEITEGGILLWAALSKYTALNGTADQHARGVEVAQTLLPDVVKAATATVRRPFRCRSKLMGSILQAFVDAVQHGVRIAGDDDEVVRGVVEVLVSGGKDDVEAVRSKAKECRRLVMRCVGLRVFMQVEEVI